MYLVINGNHYDNPKWNVSNNTGELLIYTEDNFQTVSELFTVPAGGQIERYDDDEQTGLWTVVSVEGIHLRTSNAQKQAVITYQLSTTPDDVSSQLEQAIEEGYDAAIELAGLIEDLDGEMKQLRGLNDEMIEVKNDVDGIQRTVAEKDSRVENCENLITTIQGVLDAHNARIDHLADEIAEIINKGGN